ncbi:MAG TPA: hypothetical protein VM778_03825 [Gemmatimonadota bacterium]|nr:hypothetical protein [Gemmatimonadota bacterium]
MVRVAFICFFLLITGCASGGHSDPRPIPAAWTGEIAAVGEHGHSGFSTVTVMPDGGTVVNLTLQGGSAGGRHPWQIREGRCGEDTAAIGRPDAYPPLEPDEQGNASGTASLTEVLDPDTDYRVDIHQSIDDETVVGCGELILAN